MGESDERRLSRPEDTETAGAALARAIRRLRIEGCLILLQGELGAGKTTLVRGFLRALGHQGAVPSPTYALVEPYELAGLRIAHLDLYRIADPEELEFLGWRDLEDGIVLVEWPERAPDLGARADLKLTLSHDGGGRRLRIASLTPVGRRLLAIMRGDD